MTTKTEQEEQHRRRYPDTSVASYLDYRCDYCMEQFKLVLGPSGKFC